MSIGDIGTGYLNRDFFDEAGPNVAPTHGAQKLGYDFAKPEHVELFKQRMRPDGKPLSRRQRNSKQHKMYGILLHLDASVSYWYKTLSDKDKAVARQCALDAAKLALTAAERTLCIGRGAGGKAREPCHLVGLLAAHDRQRDGQPLLHVHGVVDRAAVCRTPENRTSTIRNAREMYRRQAETLEYFNLAFGAYVSQRLGQRLDLDDRMRCVVPGVTPEQKASVSTRREQMKAYLNARKLKSTPGNRARAAKNTAKKKQPYDKEKLYQEWRDQVRHQRPLKKEKDDGFFQRALRDNLIEPGKVMWEAFKNAWSRDDRVVRVRRVQAFIEDCQPASRMDGHRAALRAIRSKSHGGLRKALLAAETAYKQARLAHFQAPRGTKVVIAKSVDLTAGQVQQLVDLSLKNGWTVRHRGVNLTRQHQQQRQEQTSQHQRRYDR